MSPLGTSLYGIQFFSIFSFLCKKEPSTLINKKKEKKEPSTLIRVIRMNNNRITFNNKREKKEKLEQFKKQN